MELQKLADAAFAAIAENTGEVFRHDSIRAAFDAFNDIVTSRGIAWLIDATTGTGMTHMGWSRWMNEARKHLDSEPASATT